MASHERPPSPLNLSLRRDLVKEEVKVEEVEVGGVTPPRSSPRAEEGVGVWSRVEQARIWSPAVTCEKENNLSSSSNNNHLEAKVVVEVRCAACGTVTRQQGPEVRPRCPACSRPAAPRQERLFKVRGGSLEHPSSTPCSVRSVARRSSVAALCQPIS